MKVVMPKIGSSMQDGKIVKWYRNDGESIAESEPMLDIEVDKLVSTIEAPGTGIFKKIAQENDLILCGTEIAEIN